MLTIAALLFNRSALSTKPNLAGGRPGELGGCVTPCKQRIELSNPWTWPKSKSDDNIEGVWQRTEMSSLGSFHP